MIPSATMARTINRSLLQRTTFLLNFARKRRFLCHPAVQQRVLHHQRRMMSLLSAQTKINSDLPHHDPNDILSAKNLPMYQYVRKVIRQKSLPDIHVSSGSGC